MTGPPAGPQGPRLDAEAPDPDRHLDFATAQFGDPRIARWHWPEQLGGPRTREQTHEILTAQARQLAETGFCLWWWRERQTGELVGMAGLSRADVEGEPVVELGWSIAPDHQRLGYATEAARAASVWGFERCDLDELVAFTLRENEASRGLMERLGMRFEREFDRKGFPHFLYRLGR